MKMLYLKALGNKFKKAVDLSNAAKNEVFFTSNSPSENIAVYKFSGVNTDLIW